jgi:hypothetical protein
VQRTECKGHQVVVQRKGRGPGGVAIPVENRGVRSGEVAAGVRSAVGGGRAGRVHMGHFQDHRCRSLIPSDVNVVGVGVLVDLGEQEQLLRVVPRLDFGVGFHPGHPLSQAHGLMPVEQTTGEPTFCSLNHSNYLYQGHQDISLTGGASQSVPARSSHGDPE